MGIIKFPPGVNKVNKLTCAICGRKISPAEATIGPANSEGNPTLLCNGHLWGGLSFIDQMADYMAKERSRYLGGNDVMDFSGDGQDAWLVY